MRGSADRLMASGPYKDLSQYYFLVGCCVSSCANHFCILHLAMLVACRKKFDIDSPEDQKQREFNQPSLFHLAQRLLSLETARVSRTAKKCLTREQDHYLCELLRMDSWNLVHTGMARYRFGLCTLWGGKITACVSCFDVCLAIGSFRHGIVIYSTACALYCH